MAPDGADKKRRGRRFAAGCVEGLCSLALRGHFAAPPFGREGFYMPLARQGALYAQHLVSYALCRMTVISRLRRLSPFGGCATTFAPVGSVSHDSQVAITPLRIVFPSHQLRWWDYGCWAWCHNFTNDAEQDSQKISRKPIWFPALFIFPAIQGRL